MVKNIPQSIKEAISKCPKLIGIGPSAWPRIIPGFYFPNYKIISYYNCQDNEFIKKFGVEVFSLKEKDPFIELSPVTPGQILKTDLAKEYLKNIKEPFVFMVYKSFGVLEKICEENGWKFIGNKKEVAEKYENKKFFKELIRELNLVSIPGESLLIEELTENKFKEYQQKLGQKKLVLQLAEVTYGGGCGTLFLEDASQLKNFCQRVDEIRRALEGKKKQIEYVNVAPFIEGAPASISCCATKYGVLTGPVQSQMIDIPEVGAIVKNRSGNFAGIDWSYKHYSEEVQKQASLVGEKLGKYMYEHGYKGVFGIDLIIDNQNKVWPVECNPRETDAYPLICMLQMEKGLVPMTVFHILEHLNIPYEIDFEEINKDYKANFEASEILIYNHLDKNVIDRNVFKAGIYELKNGEIKFSRPGFHFGELKNENEFLFTEAIPKTSGGTYKPHERIFRMIKRGGILEGEHSVKKEVKKAADFVYQQLNFLPVENGSMNINGLEIFFANRLIDFEKEENKNFDLVNIINEEDGGFRRPLKISWRREITKDPILEQINSKRTKKHIKSDLKKISQLGIEIVTMPEINEKDFQEWHSFYQKYIDQMEKGHVVIDKNWLQEKVKKGKKVGAILAFKDKKIIGGNIFLEIGNRLSLGYGVAERVDELVGGLGLLLDYYFMDYAKDQGYKEVSLGQDTNLYGYDLSTGLVSYKTRLGFIPYPANKTYWVTSYFPRFNKFSDLIMIFTGDSNKLTELSIVTDKTETDFEKYLPVGIEKFKIYKRKVLQ